MQGHKGLSRNLFKGKKSADDIRWCVPPTTWEFYFFGEILPEPLSRGSQIPPLRFVRMFCLQLHPDSEGSVLPTVAVSELAPWQQEP